MFSFFCSGLMWLGLGGPDGCAGYILWDLDYSKVLIFVELRGIHLYGIARS